MKYLSVEIWQGDEFAEMHGEMHGSASEAIDAAKWKFEHTSLEARKECTVEAWEVEDDYGETDEHGTVKSDVLRALWSSEVSE